MSPTPTPFQPKLNPDFVSAALHLNIPVKQGEMTRPFAFVTSDSRKVKPGCLFVALKGDRVDGHDFIESAITSGARGLICRRGFQLPAAATASLKDVHVFNVEDTLVAYRKLAHAWRREFSVPVVAVAGSVGKTTTKEILSAILHGRWPKVLKTEGSQNGFIGIPMTLLEMRSDHGAAVIEVGIDEPGTMKEHMQLVGATAAILTAIGPEHLERLRDLPTVAREEGYALSTVAHSGGLVVINLDDPWIRPHFNTLRVGKKICFTLSAEKFPGEVAHGKVSPDGRLLEVTGLGMNQVIFPIPLPGKHNASNLLGAITIAAGLGLTADEIHAGLKGFKGAVGRSDLQELPGGVPVVCDYYNANPSSMEAGLELLSQIARRDGKKHPRWAVLADMLELGSDEEKFHRDLANKLISLGIEHVLLFGPRMKWLQHELEGRKFSGKMAHFPSHSDLASQLATGVSPGDAVLIKGSRGMKMEEVWKLFRERRAPQRSE